MKFCRQCKTKKSLPRLAYCAECALELLGKSIKVRKEEIYKKAIDKVAKKTNN